MLFQGKHDFSIFLITIFLFKGVTHFAQSVICIENVHSTFYRKVLLTIWFLDFMFNMFLNGREKTNYSNVVKKINSISEKYDF